MHRYNFEDKSAQNFEFELKESIGTYAAKTWGNGAFVRSTLIQDKYQGQDFELCRIPVDVTLNFKGKKHMKRLSTRLPIGIGAVEFGIRYGNGKVKFENPVLVIGFNVRVTNNNYIDVVDTIAKKYEKILDTGMDLYLEEVC